MIFDEFELSGIVGKEIVRLQLLDDIRSDCGQFVVGKEALEYVKR